MRCAQVPPASCGLPETSTREQWHQPSAVVQPAHRLPCPRGSPSAPPQTPHGRARVCRAFSVIVGITRHRLRRRAPVRRRSAAPAVLVRGGPAGGRSRNRRPSVRVGARHVQRGSDRGRSRVAVSSAAPPPAAPGRGLRPVEPFLDRVGLRRQDPGRAKHVFGGGLALGGRGGARDSRRGSRRRLARAPRYEVEQISAAQVQPAAYARNAQVNPRPVWCPRSRLEPAPSRARGDGPSHSSRPEPCPKGRRDRQHFLCFVHVRVLSIVTRAFWRDSQSAGPLAELRAENSAPRKVLDCWPTGRRVGFGECPAYRFTAGGDTVRSLSAGGRGRPSGREASPRNRPSSSG